MVGYLYVSDRPYKIRTQVFRFYMPVTCSKYTESKTHQNCRFLNHYIATGILKLSFGIFLQKYSISEVYYIFISGFVCGLYRAVGT